MLIASILSIMWKDSHERNDETLNQADMAIKSTEWLIKEYEKLVRLSFEKQLGKLNEAMQWDFVQKCFNFSIALKKNKQTENISLNMVTYNRTLENPHCTPLKHFLEDKHIPLF